MSVIWITTLVLGGIGALAAVLLYVAAKKFHVHEDPRIGDIEELLPGANCGGCGYSGCHAFAVACSQATQMEGLVCPGSGNATMARIAGIMGLASVATVPKVAVLRCNGACSVRPHTNIYDGVGSCAIENSFYAGETGCQYGCLGCFDCVDACPYDALHADLETRLPVVDFSKCVGCGKCVSTCPRGLFELADHPGDRPMVWVDCKNHDKGAQAMKECEVSCIGCTKCKQVCPQDCITMDRFLANIDYSKCIGCKKCVEVCPRHCIAYDGEGGKI